MREILFKAKRIDNGEWVEGLVIKMWGRLHIQEVGNENTAYPVHIATICEYTGLDDKEGQKIFENDILRCGDLLKVSWSQDKASWTLSKKGWLYRHFFGESAEPEDVEVIGNVFDNPELFEVKNNVIHKHIETDTNVGCKANEDKKCPESRKVVKQGIYEVGDKVKIIDQWVDGCCQNIDGEMDKWLGKTLTVRNIFSTGHYLMVEDAKECNGFGWDWNDNCIEGKVIE